MSTNRTLPPAGRQSHRGRGAIAAVVVAALGLIGLAAPAMADQQGYYDNNQPDSTHATLTSVAGTKTSVEVTPLITDPTAGDVLARVGSATTYNDLFKPNPVDPIAAVKTGIASDRANTGEWTYPAAWDHDQKWHPTTRVTLTFAAPVQNPTLDLETMATLFRNHPANDNSITTGVAVSGYQWRLTGVTSSSGGAVTPTIAATSDQINAGALKLSGNGTQPTLTPAPIRGETPYLSFSSGYWCGTSEDGGDFSGRNLLTSRFPNIAFNGGVCASAKLDTHGEAVTSVTYEIDQTFASATDTGTTWNHASFTGMLVQPVFTQELSGLNTPSSLGVASHAVSDVRIGSDIVAARGDAISDDMLSPTAQSNSDAGYVANSDLVRGILRAGDTGSYTVKVPYSHATRNAYLNGWIDFNGNGQWDTGESATPVAITPDASGSGTATLTFNLPAGTRAQPGGVVARFRIADKQADVLKPTGYANSGEVEDHLFLIAPKDAAGGLLVNKSVTAITAADGSTVTGAAHKGDTISYAVDVTNDSDTAMKNVTVTDTLLGDNGLTCKADDNSTVTLPASLAPQAHIRCTGTHVVTAADVTATNVHNVATAGAQWDDPDVTPGDVPEGTDSTDTPTTPITPTGGLDVKKSVSSVTQADGSARTGDAQKGDTIAYAVDVTNNSDYAMKDVAVTDTLLGGNGLTCKDDSGDAVVIPAKLAAHQHIKCTGSHVVTTTDVTAKNVHNVATADAKWDDPDVNPGDVPGGEDSTDTPTTTTDPTGGLDVKKSVSSVTQADGSARTGDAQKGDTIAYAVDVTNDSDFAMKDVTVSDTLLGDNGLTCKDDSGQAVAIPASLGARQHIKCTGTHVVTAADVVAKNVHNVATADGKWDDPTVTPGEDPKGDDSTDTPTIPSDADGGLLVHKSVSSVTDADGASVTGDARKGDTIHYAVDVTNDSDFAMKDVAVTDTLLGDNGLTCKDDSGDAVVIPAKLAAHQHIKCTGSHVVTTTDVTAKNVHNVATADAKWDDPTVNPGDVPGGEDSTDTPTTTTDPDGGLVVQKSVSSVTNPDGSAKYTDAEKGDTIHYAVDVTNDSSFAMKDVSVTDKLLGDNGLTCKDDSGDAVVIPAKLAAHQHIRCVGTHVVTAADVTAKNVHNVATADGKWDDPTVTPGEDPKGDDSTDTPTTPSDGTGGLVVQKSVSSVTKPDGSAKYTDAEKGDTIHYAVDVTNDSDHAMKDVAVTDTLLGANGLTCKDDSGQAVVIPAKLAAHQHIKCTGSHVVTTTDVTAKNVHNVATADAKWDDPTVNPGDVPGGTGETDTPTTTTDPDGGLVVNKSISSVTKSDGSKETGAAHLGDTIAYAVDVTNNSDFAMKDVSVTDKLLGDNGLTCKDDSGQAVVIPAKLAAHQHIRCVGTHVVTAADVTAKNVHNVATADGKWDDPTVTPGDDPEGSGSTDYPTTPNVPQGGLVVKKSVSSVTTADGSKETGAALKGDTIHYAIDVTNNSDTAMKDVTVTDKMLGSNGLTCKDDDGKSVALPAKLAPKAHITCTGTHVVTAADVTAKIVHNVATADAKWDDPTVKPGDGPHGSGETDTPAGPTTPAGGVATVNPGGPQPTGTAAPSADAAGKLPRTGSDIALYGGIALLLIAGGAGVMFVIRRRARS